MIRDVPGIAGLPQVTARRVVKDRCEIRRGRIPSERLCIIDCDRCDHLFPDSGRRPDFIILHDHADGLVPMIAECKTGSASAGHTRDQLTSGARAAEEVLSGHPTTSFYPLLVHDGKLRQQEFKLLINNRNYWISFRKRRYPIKPIRCGTALDSVR